MQRGAAASRPLTFGAPARLPASACSLGAFDGGAAGGCAPVKFSYYVEVDPHLALLNRSVRHQGSIDDREPAQHAPRTEPLRQNIDMAHAIQHRYDHALLAHRRSNGIHG